MPYFILGLCIVVGLYFIVRGLRGTNAVQFRRYLGIAIFLVFTIVVTVLAASGRLGPLGWIALAIPTLFYWKNLRQAMRNLGGPRPGHVSDMETRFLRMTLDHDSGVLHGTVLDGAYRGRTLDEMPLGDLLDLLRECRIEDPQSAQVLESYLDRVHGAAWREAADGQAGGGGAGGAPGMMTPAQAREILGVSENATPDEIRAAHKRLLKTNHPDHGGSTWLAAQINLAKDVLLEGH